MIVAAVVALVAVIWALSHPRKTVKVIAKLLRKDSSIVPALINYRITTKCNSKCGFCSHKANATSHVESLDNIKRGLLMLKEAGMKKVNFTGGEPLMHPSLMVDIIIYCKEELGLRTVSIATNGSLLTGHFIFRTAQCLDSITVSCDMFDQEKDNQICCGSGGHPRRMEQASRLCRLYGIKFKINTIVNRYNVNEDMNSSIRALQPFRWHCSPVFVVDDEEDDSEAAAVRITDEEFKQFRARHRHNKCFTSGRKVSKGPIMLLGEYMQFLDEKTGIPTQSILGVGVGRALNDMH